MEGIWSNSLPASVPLLYILLWEAENNVMQSYNLLIPGTRTSDMKKSFFITNLDDPFARKLRALVLWTGLTSVTPMIKRIFWLHFWGSSNENQGSSPATQIVKQSWIWVINMFFFRCKIWFHQCAAVLDYFLSVHSSFEVANMTKTCCQVGQMNRGVWDRRRILWAVRVSVTQKVAQKCIYSVCWWHTHCFFKISVTHFSTLLCLLDKFHIVHDEQKTEVTPLTFFGIHS